MLDVGVVDAGLMVGLVGTASLIKPLTFVGHTGHLGDRHRLLAHAPKPRDFKSVTPFLQISNITDKFKSPKEKLLFANVRFVKS